MSPPRVQAKPQTQRATRPSLAARLPTISTQYPIGRTQPTTLGSPVELPAFWAVTGEGLAALRECSPSEVDLPPLLPCHHGNRPIQRKRARAGVELASTMQGNAAGGEAPTSEHRAARSLARPIRSRTLRSLWTKVSARVPCRCLHRHGKPTRSLGAGPRFLRRVAGKEANPGSRAGRSTGTWSDIRVVTHTPVSSVREGT